MTHTSDRTESAAPGILIRLKSAAFRLGKRIVFKDTDWDIARGVHWALLGPNGGGKTTLARALCREIPMVSGNIEFFFDPPDGNNTIRSRSYPLQNEIIRLSPGTPQSLFGHYGGFYQARWQSFTSEDAPMVAELIDAAERASNPKSSGVPDGFGRRTEIVSRFGIDALMHKRVLHLSHGEARKVAIARALLLCPRMLILDDPFCGLDRSARSLLRSIIDDLIAAHFTQILLITHRGDEIPEGITHVLPVDNLQVHPPTDKAALRMARTHHPVIDSEPIAKTGAANLHSPPPVSTADVRPIIDMQNVTLTYNGTRILDGINWRMRPGEHWALLGQNGAGKSTLLSLILADNPQAYANRIYLFGTRRGSGESIWDIKQRIGWVASELQSYYPDRSSCFDIVCSGFYDTIGLFRPCNDQQRQTAADQMAALGIFHLAERPLSDISTGEKRLVLLARALVKHPQLLVLDEPCQGLDALFRQKFLSLIDAVCKKQALSMIYVTHHTDELPASITHTLILEKGVIRTCGRIADR